MKLSVKPFTMIGATTRSGLLSSPLRDRFGQHYHLDFYAHSDLTKSFSVRRICSGSISTTKAASNWPRARAARHGLQIVCCGGCGISPRSMRRQ